MQILAVVHFFGPGPVRRGAERRQQRTRLPPAGGETPGGHGFLLLAAARVYGLPGTRTHQRRRAAGLTGHFGGVLAVEEDASPVGLVVGAATATAVAARTGRQVVLVMVVVVEEARRIGKVRGREVASGNLGRGA